MNLKGKFQNFLLDACTKWDLKVRVFLIEWRLEKILFFLIAVQANRYGEQCSMELGMHPKQIEGMGGHFLDFEKMKYYDCEFRMRLSPTGSEDFWWEYSDRLSDNLKIAEAMFETIRTQALPIIEYFQKNPNAFEKIELADLGKPLLYQKLGGFHLYLKPQIRLVWALVKILKHKNFSKAKEFASYGLSLLEKDSRFTGKKDFEEIINL